MFHEMCHSLYEAEPVDVQQAFESYFREVKTPQSDLAYTLINEALATAIGNGWAIEAATGKRDRDSWYDDAAIDGFAKAIYPMVREYIQDGRSLDRSFVRKSIESFGAAFPDAPYRFDILLREIVLMTDGDAISTADLRDALRAAFPVSSIYATSPVDDERSLRYLTEQRATVVVAVGEEHVGQLAPLETRFPSIADGLQELRAAREGGLLVGSDQGRAIVVMELRDRNGIAQAVDELKKRGRLDPSRTEIVRLD
jgi:hypothetical protein